MKYFVQSKIFLNFTIESSQSTGRTVFSRHIEESAFRLFLLRKLDTYKSNIGVRRKTLFLVCIRITTIYGQAELLILLSVLQGVQPYAADKKMSAPLFFLYVPLYNLILKPHCMGLRCKNIQTMEDIRVMIQNWLTIGTAHLLDDKRFYDIVIKSYSHQARIWQDQLFKETSG